MILYHEAFERRTCLGRIKRQKYFCFKKYMHRKKEFVFPTFGIPPYPITSEMDPKWNFESKSVLTSSLSLNQLEYVQLMRARRMATRRRAEAACPPCKSKKARCSDFRPCARCSQLGGKNCTGGVNNHSVRPTSSLVSKQV